MGATERLSLEAASEHTMLACEHIHRYQLAAVLSENLRVLDLACGSGYGSSILAETAAAVHGVDNDVATVDLAAATIGRRTNATFEVADAVAFLDRDLSDAYDMIVCFEGLEHFSDVNEAIRRLAEQVKKGVKLVASVPNSKAFEEENEYHVVDFGYEEALALLGKLPQATMLYQYLAEGSLICADDARELEAQLLRVDQAEPEYANHFLVIANLQPDRVTALHHGRLQLSHAPVYNRYMRNLEVGNHELRRRNNELARKLLGQAQMSTTKAGSAAAAFVVSANERIDELEATIAAAEAEITRQAGEIANRDDMILAQRRELLQLRQELVAQSAASSGLTPPVGRRPQRQ
jgi:2-polyprenyl-3-methyl-5-hydroxy-6-metoxy-1,4-benzoquinol methylase